MTVEEKYVAAAYLVDFLPVLLYVLIIALKLARLEHALDELEASAASSLAETVTATSAGSSGVGEA
jgi:hypothetical protein